MGLKPRGELYSEILYIYRVRASSLASFLLSVLSLFIDSRKLLN